MYYSIGEQRLLHVPSMLAHVRRSTHVPVGEDQIQHLEFVRECADRFNAVHGGILVKPQTLLCM